MQRLLVPILLLLLSTDSIAFRPQSNIRLQQLLPQKQWIPSGYYATTRTSTKSSFTLWVTTAMEKDESEPRTKEVESTNSPTKENNIKSEKRSVPEMPWSDLQAYALRDNLPKYKRVLPGKKPKSYALWRTMMQDVPELSGYPIEFLKQKAATDEEKAPDVLPYLDNFYFEPSGGLSGQVYGVRGLKDGTKIETAPVGQVEITIPLGYVLTEDDGVAYELGKPLVQGEEFYSLDGTTKTTIRNAGSLGKQAVSNLAVGFNTRGAPQTVGPEEDPNVMLVRLGASTGLLLAGATAMNMLSHHLTVNVFWV